MEEANPNAGWQNVLFEILLLQNQLVVACHKKTVDLFFVKDVDLASSPKKLLGLNGHYILNAWRTRTWWDFSATTLYWFTHRLKSPLQARLACLAWVLKLAGIRQEAGLADSERCHSVAG